MLQADVLEGQRNGYFLQPPPPAHMAPTSLSSQLALAPIHRGARWAREPWKSSSSPFHRLEPSAGVLSPHAGRAHPQAPHLDPLASPKAAGQGCIHLPGRSGGEELESWTFFQPPFLSCVPLGLRFPSCQAQGIWRARERQSPTAPLSQLWGSRNPTSGPREGRPAASKDSEAAGLLSVVLKPCLP